jgi:hypothetical protein
MTASANTSAAVATTRVYRFLDSSAYCGGRYLASPDEIRAN